MKLKEIASNYQIEKGLLMNYLESAENTNIPFTKGLMDWSVEDNYVSLLATKVTEKIKEKEQAVIAKEENEKQKKKALSELLVTSGYHFEGYSITKYADFLSKDDAVSLDRGLAFFNESNVKDHVMESIATIRSNALNKLKEAAYNLGCNALIGVTYNYITLDPETTNFNGSTAYQPYVFGVTANGTAVQIKKKTAENQNNENLLT